ncbi:hypothetical protein WJX74_000273 [Apatococcus lobatus]|uniref:Glutathione S-transferase 3, mitochondrial n=1 Tax=Apatococcus lobatus TaxID=904363 RepID=A0AAW1R1D4_9CHLO
MAPNASLNLAPEFGWVLGAAAFTGVVYMWQSIQVGAARRKYGVKYPKMYADGESKEAQNFNCIQRSHQNTSEQIGPVLVTQALLGLYHPITAASLGAIWAIGRIVYAVGYSSGDPAKRTPGSAVSFLSYFGLLGAIAVVGFRSVTG